MRIKGVNYDAGVVMGINWRPFFDPQVVRRELQIIKQDIHCNAVGIAALDVRRLSIAAKAALEQGLDVWASPTLWDKSEEETVAYLVRGADVLEPLRKEWPDKVKMSVGAESTLFMKGILEGRNVRERLGNPKFGERVMAGKHNGPLNAFLAKAVTAVKKEFHGELTYHSLIWEKVDWTLFDYVGVDHYRANDIEGRYVEMLKPLLETGKPVINTGFGYGTYESDGKLAKVVVAGGDVDTLSLFLHSLPVLGRLVRPRVRSVHKRDEAWQARKLEETLGILDAAGVEGTFVDTFVSQINPYDDNPRHDLDATNLSLVKSYDGGRKGETYPDMPWEPKESFRSLSKYYAEN